MLSKSIKQGDRLFIGAITMDCDTIADSVMHFTVRTVATGLPHVLRLRAGQILNLPDVQIVCIRHPTKHRATVYIEAPAAMTILHERAKSPLRA